MNWTPKATPPKEPNMPLVWVHDEKTDEEWACFSYFLPALTPCQQWTIENDTRWHAKVLFWMDIESPYKGESK